jgi:hypothetical protein
MLLITRTSNPEVGPFLSSIWRKRRKVVIRPGNDSYPPFTFPPDP